MNLGKKLRNSRTQWIDELINCHFWYLDLRYIYEITYGLCKGLMQGISHQKSPQSSTSILDSWSSQWSIHQIEQPKRCVREMISIYIYPVCSIIYIYMYYIIYIYWGVGESTIWLILGYPVVSIKNTAIRLKHHQISLNLQYNFHHLMDHHWWLNLYTAHVIYNSITVYHIQ